MEDSRISTTALCIVSYFFDFFKYFASIFSSNLDIFVNLLTVHKAITRLSPVIREIVFAHELGHQLRIVGKHDSEIPVSFFTPKFITLL